MNSRVDPILIPFQGELLACATLPDAAAIRLASRVLANVSATGWRLAELDQIADVLVRYQRYDAAEQVRAAWHRSFAAAILGDHPTCGEIDAAVA